MHPENRIYFPEIDGLRGIAVTSVILFHLGFELIAGGYIGVDVFFVISGYLITRNITDDVSLGKFSFTSFYYRRIRRLFPALLFTLIITSIFSFLILSPSHLERFCESLFYAVISVSNFYFWGESGYFDTSSSFKPLLHFWSLAVEEQFYLIWPATLVLVLSIKKPRLIIGSLILLGTISIIASELVITNAPSAAFYLTPFRIMEFSIGASCVWLFRYQFRDWQYEIGMTLGLTIIVYTLFSFDEKTTFPGINSLIPCLGAALVILSSKAQISGKLLRNKLIVRIGLISYSLYLIHWPVIIFYSYWTFEPTIFGEKLILLLVSFILAEFMYRYVEKKFRMQPTQKERITPTRFFSLFTLILVILLIPAVHAINNDGWGWRIDEEQSLDAEVINLNCRDTDTISKYESKCVAGLDKNGPAEILLLGDSHAKQLIPAMDYLGKKYDLKVDIWTHNGCPPIWETYKIFGPNTPPRQHTCKNLIPKWEEQITSGKYKFIILANRWMWLYEPTSYGDIEVRRDYLVDRIHPVHDTEISRQLFRSRLELTIEQIHKHGSKAIVFSQIPLLAKNVQDCDKVPSFIKHSLHKRCYGNIEYKNSMARLAYTNDTIRQLSSKLTMSVIPSDYICSQSKKRCHTILEGTLIYRDTNHLNKKGSLLLAKKIETEFTKFVTNKL